MCQNTILAQEKKEPLAEYANEIGLSGKLEFYKDLAGFDRGFIYVGGVGLWC